jgi:hypothetical protein
MEEQPNQRFKPTGAARSRPVRFDEMAQPQWNLG